MDSNTDPQKSSKRETAIREISDWAIARTLDGTRLEDIFDGFCVRLDSLVVPLLRSNMAIRALHPLLAAVALTWRRAEGVRRFSIPHGSGQGEEWQQSPYQPMLEQRQTERRIRLEGTDEYTEHSILVDLRGEGATEYLALLTSFGEVRDSFEGRDGMLSSWATDRPGGLGDEDVAALRRLVPRLGVGVKMAKSEQTAENVISAYLGSRAGRRVLDGHIRLGDGETIRAVIWYSDMRDSTALADSLEADEFLAALNAYFECSAGAVRDHGGDVLRFIGDAVLAIFSVEGPGGTESAARVALSAARDARARMDRTNRERGERGQPELAFGLGLHVGDLMYGNIGIPERIEFSVIGPAANEVDRLQELTKELGHAVVVSSAFADLLPIAWQPLGRHHLRGVGRDGDVFAPPAE